MNEEEAKQATINMFKKDIQREKADMEKRQVKVEEMENELRKLEGS